MLTLIVARARNGAIGLGNDLPWHLPEDLAFFKRATMGATLVMGRRTWESIGRPLPGRKMVVVSRRPIAGVADGGSSTAAAGDDVVTRASSLEDALQRHGADGRELFVIGGADVFRQVMPVADRILMTEIDSEPQADTFMDAPADDDWIAVSREERAAPDGTRFAWVDLRRRDAHPTSAAVGTAAP
ncbi:MAG: dihydrofolate reductase [Burkholderiaceae bacterium]